MEKKWKISVDTGGTFTDGIGQHPDGGIKRIKVLSSGCIKGLLVAGKGKWWVSDLVEEYSCDIFKGYSIYINGEQCAYKVEAFDFENHSFLLDGNPNIILPAPFVLTAHEESPILAVRCLTETPLDDKLPPIEFRLGTTKGTNALLEKKGAKTCLIITKGFRDLLYIGTQQRPDLFCLDIPEPELLYDFVFELDARTDKDGNEIIPLNEIKTTTLIKKIKDSGYDSVAVALLHSYRNPSHEQTLKKACEKSGIRQVSISSELYKGIHLLPRASTTVVNAYLSPLWYKYIEGIKKLIPNLKIMSSSAGLVDADSFHPKDGLLSGPAGGVLGAASIAENSGIKKILTLDMGGTSTDVSRYDTRIDYKYITQIGQQKIAVNAVDVETVAAGGGSICYFDGFKLCVGPESAGAHPGPACYGAGGPLTMTDINLLLGRLNTHSFKIPIFKIAAENKLTELIHEIESGTQEKYSKTELLFSFEKIASEKMAEAIRKISIAKGFNPKEYTLLAFGGAGGLHACSVAEQLGIRKIIIPYDAGLLSARGIQEAKEEKWAGIQILKSLKETEEILPEIITTLKNKILFQFQKTGIEKEKIIFQKKYIYLRISGQNNTIELNIGNNIANRFYKKYNNLFGYDPIKKSIEVESIKILGIIKTAFNNKNNTIPKINKLKTHPEENKLIWSKLNPGDSFQGESIISNSFGTVYTPSNWETTIQKDKNIFLNKIGTKKEIIGNKTSLELELFSRKFMTIAEQSGLQLQRTASSVNIKERLDFSCAILDTKAELLANAPHIPVHLGSLGLCARLILKKLKLEKGDVVITNHPKYGGSHLPDVTLMSAAFDPQGRLIGYLINRAHHAEIGGTRPGSMPPDATCLEEEGVVIPPMYLMKQGKLNTEILHNLMTQGKHPTRAYAENRADINAALAALKFGEKELEKLSGEYRLEKIHFYMAELKKTSSKILWQSLQKLNKNNFSATEFLDDGNRLQVDIKIIDKKIVINFKGSSDVHPNNLNANPAIVNSVIIYVLQLITNDNRLPLNEGLMKNVEIILPKNSLLHPDFDDNPEKCPAVVGGNTEVSQRLTDLLLKAFGIAACSQGTMNNLLFGNQTFGYYETIGGGVGAGKGFNGRSAVHQHMTNTKITDPEELEFRYPVRLWQFGKRNNSGGDGKFKGGNGIVREIEFLEKMDVTLLSQHRKELPYGLEGGEPGKIGEQYIIRKNGDKEKLEHIDKAQVKKGDRIIILTPGGGGYGKKNKLE